MVSSWRMHRPFGTIFLIMSDMPIGITSISSEDTGIAFFRDLITRLATNYPKLMLVDNANMIRRNRAIPSMIKNNDDPHFSERGKKQMVENLMAALRIAQADIASYAFVVNDHYVKVKRDPHRPSPKARFNRRAPSHTGIQDQNPPRSTTTSSEVPATTPSYSTTSDHASYAAAVSSQDTPAQATVVRASSLLQLTRKALAAMATTSTTSSRVVVFNPSTPVVTSGMTLPASAPTESSTPSWALPPPLRETDPAPSAPSPPTDILTLPGGSGATGTPTSNAPIPSGSGARPKTQSATPQDLRGSGARPKTRGATQPDFRKYKKNIIAIKFINIKQK